MLRTFLAAVSAGQTPHAEKGRGHAAQSRAAKSDARGLYTIPELPLTGAWRIRIAHDGFRRRLMRELGDEAGPTP